MLLSLTNSKADVGVRLDSAQRKISTYSDVQAEFAARDEDNNVSSGGWRWCLKLLPAGKRHPGEWPQARWKYDHGLTLSIYIYSLSGYKVTIDCLCQAGLFSLKSI